MKDSLMDPGYVNFFPSLYMVKHYILRNKFYVLFIMHFDITQQLNQQMHFIF
jgi:hypothetical protein